MRITARLLLALGLSAAAVAGGSTYFQTRLERLRSFDDLERRSALLAETLDETAAPALAAGDSARLARLVQRFGSRPRLAGLAVVDATGKLVAVTPALAGHLGPWDELVKGALGQATPATARESVEGKPSHAYVFPIRDEHGVHGAFVVVHDASYIDARVREMWRHNFLRLVAHLFILCLVTLWIIRWNLAAPLDQLVDWMKRVRSGESAEPPPVGLFGPIAVEAGHLAKTLATARAAVENEAQLRVRAQSVWTPDRLREHVKDKLGGRPLFVVANREPYMHVRDGKKIDVIRPASGLVTAVEPILRACGGLWLAHGAGDADKETADANGKLAVPPGEPHYFLRRVWLTKEEEQGYYYGFSNEGLWPLCHIVHARPIFKARDWEHYKAVNLKFAQALLEEIRDEKDPCVLVQDYQFALLPQMIKEARPDARVALFWHIPWPNPEAFGICPWQREIINGILGADLVGFHIQSHCNNFLETVDRTLECRIDWERFAVQRGGRWTSVKPFPISIAFPREEGTPPAPGLGAKALLKELGVEGELLGVGVDRMDYTKGIIERFLGIERFLERYAEYRGRLVFIQIGAPSRVHIERYRELITRIEAEVDRINWRFQAGDYKPIVLLKKHHAHEEIEVYYKAADFCMVTSLHDGMNLVAKEFAAARHDERGSLILSRFTGAARELGDALIVNPYDFEQMAEAIRFALGMSPEDQQRRMRAMRASIKDHNVYAWGADLINQLVRIRLPEAEARKAKI